MRRTGQCVYRNPGVYTLRVFVGRDAEGKRLVVNYTFYGSEAQAQKELARLNKKVLKQVLKIKKTRQERRFEAQLNKLYSM